MSTSVSLSQTDSPAPDPTYYATVVDVRRRLDGAPKPTCGAVPGYRRRSGDRGNTRNGNRHRYFDTRVGALDVAVPTLRQGSYFQDWFLYRRKRAERAVTSVVSPCHLFGVSCSGFRPGGRRNSSMPSGSPRWGYFPARSARGEVTGSATAKDLDTQARPSGTDLGTRARACSSLPMLSGVQWVTSDAHAGLVCATGTPGDEVAEVAEHLDAARADLLAFTAFRKQIWSDNPQGPARPPVPNQPRCRINPGGRLESAVEAAQVARQGDERIEGHRYLGLDVLARHRSNSRPAETVTEPAEEVTSTLTV